MADIEKIIKFIKFVNEQHKAFGTLIYLGNAAEKHIERILTPFDLPVNKYRVLRGLRTVHPSGVPIYKLRDFLIDQKCDISRLVQRMVDRGIVKRRKDNDNKSITQVILTPQGLTLVDEVDKHMEEFFEPMMCLSNEEATVLNHTLEKVLDSFMMERMKQTAVMSS